MWGWFLVVFFGFGAVAAYVFVRRTSRTLEMTDPDKPPPRAPPAGSADAEWEQQQREAWAREHPDWADWERSYDNVPPEDAPSGSSDSESKPK